LTAISIEGGSDMAHNDLIEELPKSLRPVSDEQGANATVALLLKLKNLDLSVLFVRRVENSADPWSGQIAFPGGKRDAKDQNLKQTVIRETLEETNINLLDNCRFLGAMNALISKPRPEIRVLPFIILLEHEPSVRLNEKELNGFVWISLEEIIRSKGTAKFSFGESPAYIVGSTVIWGLTYRVLENLFHILETS
jgi:8-oxo-dGTP diphosphatase